MQGINTTGIRALEQRTSSVESMAHPNYYHTRRRGRTHTHTLDDASPRTLTPTPPCPRAAHSGKRGKKAPRLACAAKKNESL